jgi:hypothetical protein
MAQEVQLIACHLPCRRIVTVTDEQDNQKTLQLTAEDAPSLLAAVFRSLGPGVVVDAQGVQLTATSGALTDDKYTFRRPIAAGDSTCKPISTTC